MDRTPSDASALMEVTRCALVAAIRATLTTAAFLRAITWRLLQFRDPLATTPVAAGGPPTAGPRLIADRYTDKKTSDLKYAVNEGVNIIVLKLDGPWANPPVEEEQEDDDGEQSDDESTEDGAIKVGDDADADKSTPKVNDVTAANAKATETPSDAPPSNKGAANTSQQTPAEEQPQ